VLEFGPKKIENIAVITGSGQGFFDEAVRQGAKTIITGSLKVESPDVAKELGLNVIACGHYNTEKVGIIALGKLVAKEFNISEEFIDIPNPI
jgi:putative NIF3 family GTP cyclohydrolase 1 type 2